MTQPSPWENLWEQATLWVAGELNDTFRKVHSKKFSPTPLSFAKIIFHEHLRVSSKWYSPFKSSIFEWDFPRNQRSSYRGSPMTMETSMTLETFRSQDQAKPRVYRLRKSLLMEAPPQFLGSDHGATGGHFEAQSLKPSKFGSTQCWPIPVSQLIHSCFGGIIQIGLPRGVMLQKLLYFIFWDDVYTSDGFYLVN